MKPTEEGEMVEYRGRFVPKDGCEIGMNIVVRSRPSYISVQLGSDYRKLAAAEARRIAHALLQAADESEREA